MAGGRSNVEAGLQTGLDVVATMVWWDWEPEEEKDGLSEFVDSVGLLSIILGASGLVGCLILICGVALIFIIRNPRRFRRRVLRNLFDWVVS